jgi:hypothetical protein
MKGLDTYQPIEGQPMTNERTYEDVNVLEKAEAGGQSAIDYMLEVMRDNKNDTGLRLDAAKAVARVASAVKAWQEKPSR